MRSGGAPWERWVPAFGWARRYRRGDFSADLVAGIIVTIMLIPQSMAHALLAGLPPQVGLHAAILPLVAYALFGSSDALAVGPVDVVGQVPGTEHFRNILRHRVATGIGVLAVRVDESLYFANARYLEDHLYASEAA